MIKKHSIKKRKNANNALDQPTVTKKKWVTFGYYSPLVRKVTNLLKIRKYNSIQTGKYHTTTTY